jgi:hypothetical protein
VQLTWDAVDGTENDQRSTASAMSNHPLPLDNFLFVSLPLNLN